MARWAHISHLAQWAQMGMHSPCDSDQPVADGPVGPSVTLGPVGLCGTLSQCNPDPRVADGPVGSTDELGLVGPRGMLLRIDIKKVVPTDEPANSVGTSPSSDLGIHSLGEQWEDTSEVTTDTEENRTERCKYILRQSGVSVTPAYRQIPKRMMSRYAH